MEMKLVRNVEPMTITTAKLIYGNNVEELEIIRRAIYIAGRQSLQKRPSNKDEKAIQTIKNGGHVETNGNWVIFEKVSNKPNTNEWYIEARYIFGIHLAE